MASKNRPHREQKKKPKVADAKPKLQSFLETPPPSVELIKPKRKPREQPEEE